MFRTSLRGRLLATVSFCLAVGVGADGALAANVPVNNSDPSGPGSLLEAIDAVNTGGGVDTITLDPDLTGQTLDGGGGTPVFEGGGITTSANNVTLSHNITVGAGGAVVDTNGNTLTLSGVIDDGFSGGILTKAGAGTLVLDGANTLTGEVVLEEGTLRLGTSEALGDGYLTTLGSVIDYADGVDIDNIVIVSSDTTQFQVSSGTATHSGLIADDGNDRPIEKTGDGTLVLSGAGFYGGQTHVTDGTLQIAAPGAIPSSSDVTVNAGATLKIDENLFFVDIGSLADGPDGGGGVEIGEDSVLSLGDFGFNTDDTTFSGAITGAGGLELTGAGILTLTGQSHIGDDLVLCDCAGGLNIDGGSFETDGEVGVTGGTLNVRNGGALTAGSGSVIEGFFATAAGAVTGTGSTWTTPWLEVGVNGPADFTVAEGGLLDAASDVTIGADGRLLIGTGGTAGSVITPDIFNDGQIIADFTDGATLSADISGTGSLTQQGSGTLTLTGAHTATGGVTISAGTLQIGDGGTGGSVDGDIANDGVLAFNRSDDMTLGGVISGTGSVLQRGGGVTTLTGTNTYQGGTTITGGAIAVSADDNLGAASGGVALDGGALRIDTGFASGRDFTLGAGNGAIVVAGGEQFTVNGVIDGAGGLTKDGAGDLILTQANTYGGGTTLSGGVTYVTADGALGTGDVTNNATLDVGDTTVANAIDGTGGLQKTTAGLAVLTGTNSYSGGTVITQGTLQIGDGGATGSITGPITNDGTLVFNRTGTLTLSGDISGAGAVVQDGTGTTVLTGAGNHTGGTTINAGRLQIGDGGTTGSLAGDVVMTGGTLAVDRSDYVFLNAVDGSAGGALVKNGGGVLFLTGDNAYADGVTINAGTLQVGSGGTSGSLQGAVVNDGVLAFFRTDTHSFAGAVSGSGQIQQYDGDLTLSGANTYSGGTNIYGGTLRVGATGALGSGMVISDGVIDIGDAAVTNDIFGSGRVTKTTAGLATLTGSSYYVGGTTLSAGTLLAGGSSSLGAGVVTITGGTLAYGDGVFLSNAVQLDGAGVFSVGNGLSAYHAGAIGEQNGPRTLTKTGLGTLTLVGTNTYTGGTTIAQGTLRIGQGGLTGSIEGPVVNDGTLIVSRHGEVTLGAISGSGALVQDGSGTTVLASTNTYSGGTTIRYGTLQVGDGGTTGSLTGPVTMVGGELAFNRSDDVTFSGDVDGSAGGSLRKQQGGTLVLAGNNTYAGGVLITNGTLQVGAGGTSGSLQGAVTNDGVLAFNRSDAITFGGGISGSGSVSLLGGDLTLTGTNTYAGGTTIAGGTLRINSAYALGGGAVTNNAVLNLGDGAAIANAISGTGRIDHSAGAARLTGANSFSGGVRLSGGTLSVGGSTSLGTGAVAFTGGALAYDNQVSIANAIVLDGGSDLTVASGAATQGGVISELNGPRGLNKLGAGTLTLTGANTYTGATTVSAGTLRLGDGGSVAGAIVNNATLAFGQTGSLTFGNAVSGTGAIVKDGAGTLTLTGANTYAGGTTINDGTLQVGAGGTVGSILGPVVNNATLAFNRSDAVTFGGAISGSGSVRQLGGILTLAGTNTYSGGTIIAGGTLRVTTGAGLGTGAVTNNAVLDLGDTTVVNVVDGTGRVDKSSTGLSALTGANTYSGGTNLSAGTLLVGGSTSLGTGAVAFTGGALAYGDGVSVGNAVVLDGGSAFSVGAGLSATQSGIVSEINGPRGLVKTGLGTLTLTGANTYTGGTTISQGTLVLGGSATLSGPVVNNSILSFGPAGTTTFANPVSGIGQVVQNGPGTTILTGLNTYTGGTLINGGTLQLGAGGTSGSIVGDVAMTGGVLAFNRSDPQTFGGVISGAGSVTLMGGTLTLTGANTYSGGTTIAGGTLRVTGSGTLGSGAVTTTGSVIDYADGVTLANPIVVNSNTTQLQVSAGSATQGGVISEAGGARPLEKIGAGTLVLTGANAYSGLTTVTAGTLQLGAGGTTGSLAGPVAVAAGATLGVDRSNAIVINNLISGVGGLRQQGAGTLTLTADNTYTGLTNVTAGALRIGAGGTSGAVAGDIALSNGAGLIFDRSNTLTYGGAVSGSGTLRQQGTGTLILTGTNTYSGGTTITGGTLQVGAGGTAGSITGDVVNSGVLAFNRSDAVNFGGAISGAGSVTLMGGSLTLAGSNTYTGGTIIAGGTLRAATSTALGSGAVTTTGSVLDYADGVSLANPIVLASNTTQLQVSAGSATQGGAISETGGARPLEKIGAGTLVLTGTNTYSGPTTVTAGRLQLGAGGTTGSIAGAVTVAGGASLDVNRSDAVTMANLISGAGAVRTLGGATLTLTADNTYTGLTTVAGGLQIGAGGSTGAVAGNIALTGGAGLTFNRSNDLTYGGVVSGSGTLRKEGAGVLTLTGANTSAGPTTIAAGTLQLGAGGTAGSIAGDVVNSGVLAFNRSDATTFAGVISGTGAVRLAGGDLTLTRANTYTGGTTIQAGSLTIGGSLTGDVANAGALVFDRSGASTFAGMISGAGSVRLANGDLSLTGNNSYTGGTTISAGTLTLGAGGTGGAILGNVAVSGGARLAFDRSNDLAFGGVISGAGGVRKSGAGILNLTGVNTYTGATVVDQGRLAVNGSIAGSAVTVNSGGVLGGTGTVGAVTVASGGQISAGNSIGTLTISGALTFNAGSGLVVEVNPLTADRVEVTGAASLNGTVTALYSGSANITKRRTILHAAGGVTGTFSSLNATLPTGFTAGLAYDANNAFLDLNLALATQSGLNLNQQGVVDSLADFFDRTGGIDQSYALLTAEQLTEVDGEAAAANVGFSFNAIDQFLGGLSDKAPGASGPVEVAGPWMFRAPAWSAWGSLSQRDDAVDGNATLGSRDTHTRSRQIMAGADRSLSQNTIFGMAVAQGDGEFKVVGAGGGRGEADLLQAGVYGRHHAGRAYLAGALVYGRQNTTIDRTVTIAGTDRLQSRVKVESWAARLEAGLRISLSALDLTPYASARTATADIPAYAERVLSGSAAYALTYAAQKVDSYRFELGTRAERTIDLDAGLLTLSARGALVSEDSDAAAVAGLQALPGSTFTVGGASPDGRHGLAAVGANLALKNGISLSASADSEFGGDKDSYAGRVGVRVAW